MLKIYFPLRTHKSFCHSVNVCIKLVYRPIHMCVCVWMQSMRLNSDKWISLDGIYVNDDDDDDAIQNYACKIYSHTLSQFSFGVMLCTDPLLRWKSNGFPVVHMLRFWQSHCISITTVRNRQWACMCMWERVSEWNRKIVDIIQFNNKTIEIVQDQCAMNGFLVVCVCVAVCGCAPQSTYFSTKSTSKPKNTGKKNNKPLLNVQLLCVG